MSKNSKQSTDAAKRASRSPLQKRVNKIFRHEDASFENEASNILLASDESGNKEDIEDFLVSDADFVQNHKSDQEDEEIAFSTQDIRRRYNNVGGTSRSSSIKIKDLENNLLHFIKGSDVFVLQYGLVTIGKNYT
ncbi:hypothetical protein FQA39_LY02214 [Lamprigera yunnana]|nr:hypothetical protein FQA39_LY02214 [Lamprigera yunnana]